MKQASMKIAMIGTRGVPANYGGFETCVEELGQRLVRNIIKSNRQSTLV